MIKFTVSGPIKVPIEKLAKASVIDEERIKSFWKSGPIWKSFATKIGCYVFAFGVSKGHRPLYVGKTINSFKKECFSTDKVKKINKALADNTKGRLVIFFVVCPTVKGVKKNEAIDEIETFLIHHAFNKNPDLINDKKKPQPKWSIKGVHLSGKGEASNSSRKFKKGLGIP